MEHNVFMQVQLVWSLTYLELWIDRVVALNLTSTPIALTDERTEDSDFVFGRAFDTPSEYAMMSVDEVYVWDDINPPNPYVTEGTNANKKNQISLNTKLSKNSLNNMLNATLSPLKEDKRRRYLHFPTNSPKCYIVVWQITMTSVAMTE